MHTVKPGMTSTSQFVVERHHLVPALFPGVADMERMPRVLSTPWLLAMIEKSCIDALAPNLNSGSASVGAKVTLEHTGPSKEGDRIVIEVTCEAVDGRRVCFRAIARDDTNELGRAEHDRFLIDLETFKSKLGA